MKHLVAVFGLLLTLALAWDEPNEAFSDEDFFASLAAEGCLGTPFDDGCALALTQANAKLTRGVKRLNRARKLYQKTTAPENSVEPSDDMRRESGQAQK